MDNAEKTYQEYQDEIRKLQEAAEVARNKEIAAVIADIRSKIELYGLNAQDLGLNAEHRQTKPRSRSQAAPKFMSPAGETWTGRGRTPQWVKDLEASGKSIEEFRVAAKV